jgi:UDP-glucose 4-epimerase
MKRLTVWITGARGFIGRHLARSLAAEGHQVWGLGHGLWADAEAREWGLTKWLNGDVQASNLQSLARLQAEPPQVIFHLAGGSSVGAALAQPHEDFQRTATTTAHLLDWLRLEAPATHLIAISSAAVYGAAHSAALAEDANCQPCSPYGYHKLIMEQLCQSYAQSYGLRSTLVRLFSVYGSGLKKQLLWDLCTRLSGGAATVELGGSGDELRDWTDVRDVVRALTFLMEPAAHTPVINAGTGLGTPIKRIAEHVLAAWPRRAQITFSGKVRRGDPFSLVADSQLLAAMNFQWTIPVEQGIADYVGWFLTQQKSAQ